MAKLIPYIIKRRGVGSQGWNVIHKDTKEIVEHFDTKEEASEFVKHMKRSPGGEWEPDYEGIMENRDGDPEAKLDAMENSYERYMGL